MNSSFVSRFFNETPKAIFRAVPGVDPTCIDYYNPAPIDIHGVTFLFPAATLHLVEAGQPNRISYVALFTTTHHRP